MLTGESIPENDEWGDMCHKFDYNLMYLRIHRSSRNLYSRRGEAVHLCILGLDNLVFHGVVVDCMLNTRRFVVKTEHPVERIVVYIAEQPRMLVSSAPCHLSSATSPKKTILASRSIA